MTTNNYTSGRQPRIRVFCINFTENILALNFKISLIALVLVILQACSFGEGQGALIANEYFSPHPNDYITVSSASGNSTNNLKKGFYHYQKGEYQAALESFKKSNTVGNPRLQLYMAVAHIDLGNFVQAEKILEGLIVVNGSEYIDIAYWYLSLAYLKQEKIPAAEAIFQAFATREAGRYRQSESAEILEKLQAK